MEFQGLILEKLFYKAMIFVLSIPILLAIINSIISKNLLWLFPGIVAAGGTVWTLNLLSTVKKDVQTIIIRDLEKVVRIEYQAAQVKFSFQTIDGIYVFTAEEAVTKKENVVGFSMQLVHRIPQYDASNLIIIPVDEQMLNQLKTQTNQTASL